MFNPLTQVAAAAMLPTLASGLGEAISSVGKGFLDVFAQSPDAPSTRPNAQTDEDSISEDPAERPSLLDSISERVRELLGNTNHDLGDSLHIDISPLGQLYVLNNHPEARAIQANLDEDSKLKDQMRQWLNQGGSDSLVIPIS